MLVCEVKVAVVVEYASCEGGCKRAKKGVLVLDESCGEVYLIVI